VCVWRSNQLLLAMKCIVHSLPEYQASVSRLYSCLVQESPSLKSISLGATEFLGNSWVNKRTRALKEQLPHKNNALIDFTNV
jgi:hypothetical protein